MIEVSRCGKYKKMERSLYRLSHGLWHHICLLPVNVGGIDDAINFYLQIEDEEA